MSKGNILVIGNSGVGKSTLINAVLGVNARTGIGEAVTQKMEIYECPEINFRLIDTIGFEPGVLQQAKAINEVKKWSKESIKGDQTDRQINVIWYCIDATSRKLFKKNIAMLTRATSMWKDVPVIVVLTKSYSSVEIHENVKMVQEAFKRLKHPVNLKAVVPVVAEIYRITENQYVPAQGIENLVDVTESLMPEGKKATLLSIYQYKTTQKRAQAHGLVASCAAAGAVVGAVPIPFPDGLILTPLETGMIAQIARIYNIPDSEKLDNVVKALIEAGTVGVVAHALINAVKAIPAVNIAASVLNSVMASAIITALGESTIFIMEKIYTGEKSMNDMGWIDAIIENNVAGQVSRIMDVINDPANTIDGKKNWKRIISEISKLAVTMVKKKKGTETVEVNKVSLDQPKETVIDAEIITEVNTVQGEKVETIEFTPTEADIIKAEV